MNLIELPQAMKESYGVTAVYLKQLLLSVDVRGVSLEPLLTHCMIDPDRLNNDRFYRVPFFKLKDFLSSLGAILQDPTIAIKAVFTLRVKSFPLIGYAVSASPTLRVALERLILLEPVVWDVGSIYQEDGEETTQLIWSSYIDVSPIAVEMAIAGWVAIGKQQFPASKQINKVTFKHSCLSQSSQYQDLFGCPVVFNAEVNSIIFPSHWLEEKLIDSDDTLAELMTAQANALIENYVPALNFENTIRSALFQALPNELPDLNEMAKLQDIPARKMRYLLNDKHLSYRQIVDDVRKEVAHYLLLQGTHPIGEIAGFCGFLEQSSFNRAFKRWFECSPSDYVLFRNQKGFGIKQTT